MTAIKKQVRRALRSPRWFWLARAFLFVRGLIHVGRRHQCPCCGWSLRSFTVQQGFVRSSTDGYCPRCNAKARHRRIWLYLDRNMAIFDDELRLLEIAPWIAFARRFGHMRNVEYANLDLEQHAPFVQTVGDVTAMPFDSGSFDAVVCVHVLEHVQQDRHAMAEIRRVLGDGWALVTVPLNLDAPTDEDPTVTSHEERTQRFGEASHVRMYGLDIIERLEHAGFSVEVDLATGLADSDVTRYGLRRDEHILLCRPAPQIQR